MSTKRIAVNTGGRHAPGLNAVIRAIVLSALNRGWRVPAFETAKMDCWRRESIPRGIDTVNPGLRQRHHVSRWYDLRN